MVSDLCTGPITLRSGRYHFGVRPTCVQVLAPPHPSCVALGKSRSFWFLTFYSCQMSSKCASSERSLTPYLSFVFSLWGPQASLPCIRYLLAA